MKKSEEKAVRKLLNKSKNDPETKKVIAIACWEKNQKTAKKKAAGKKR